jgi:hypothetical protein
MLMLSPVYLIALGLGAGAARLLERAARTE